VVITNTRRKLAESPEHVSEVLGRQADGGARFQRYKMTKASASEVGVAIQCRGAAQLNVGQFLLESVSREPGVGARQV